MILRAHTFLLALLFACVTVYPISAAAHANATDQSAVLQSVLDYPQLQAFLHPKSPGRVPVSVFVRGAALGIRAEKFGAAVHILTKDSRPAPTVIRLTQFSIGDDTAEVALHYPVEGIDGRFSLRCDGKVWRVTRANIHET